MPIDLYLAPLFSTFHERVTAILDLREYGSQAAVCRLLDVPEVVYSKARKGGPTSVNRLLELVEKWNVLQAESPEFHFRLVAYGRLLTLEQRENDNDWTVCVPLQRETPSDGSEHLPEGRGTAGAAPGEEATAGSGAGG